jgi:hypothetical protein
VAKSVAIGRFSLHDFVFKFWLFDLAASVTYESGENVIGLRTFAYSGAAEEVFLPYVVNAQDKTLFGMFEASQFKLPLPQEE